VNLLRWLADRHARWQRERVRARKRRALRIPCAPDPRTVVFNMREPNR
jgi:hypothetical protein